MEPGLDSEAEDRTIETALKKRLDHGGRRSIRMDVDRYVQSLRGFEDGPELRIVEVFAARMRIDDRAFESQELDAAFQFLGRGCRVLRCDRCEARKSVRIPADRIHHEVVARSRERHCVRRIEDLNAGRSKRQDLLRDASLIHIPQPELAQIGHARDDFRDARAWDSQDRNRRGSESRDRHRNRFQ